MALLHPHHDGCAFLTSVELPCSCGAEHPGVENDVPAYLTPGADALTKALGDCWRDDWANRPNDVTFQRLAAALIASGAVVAADTLADDETLVPLVGRAMYGHDGEDFTTPGSIPRETVRRTFHALATALPAVAVARIAGRDDA